MAIRVQSNADINFGTVSSPLSVTHVRIQDENDTNPSVKQLQAPVVIASGQELVIPSGEFDMVFPSGDFGNGLMEQVISSYFTNRTMHLDCLTSQTVVVTATGYSQQSHNGWQSSQEAD